MLSVTFAPSPDPNVLFGPSACDYLSKMDNLLARSVNEDGLVDYELLRGDLNEDLESLVTTFAECPLPNGSQADHVAFWLNAYNLLMLQNIAQNPDVRDIIADGYADKFFKEPKVVAGVSITLDQIENTVLRKDRPTDELHRLAVDKLDPRIHVGLNCAAISCPALDRTSFRSASLDYQLDTLMRKFVNSDQHFRVSGDRVIASSLLSWFASDWDSTSEPGGDYLLGYMCKDRSQYKELKDFMTGRTASDLASDESVSLQYDWRINSQ